MEKKVVFGIALVLLLTCVLTLPSKVQPVKAEPTTWIVDDDGTADFHTIQEAINTANPGDTIFVRNGTYYEHVFVNKTVSLVGENQEATIVDGNVTETVVQITADNVSLVNFTIRNAGRTWGPPPGVGYPDSCVRGSTVANIHIEKNNFTGAAVCVWLVYSSFVNLSDNIVSDATYAGIIGYSSSNITIHRNFMFDCGLRGIHLDGSSNHCKIVDDTVMNTIEGMELEAGSATNRIEGNNLINNNVSIVLNRCGSLNVFRRNNMTSSQYNLIVFGNSLDSFMQDIDTSNLVNDKIPYYLTNLRDQIISPSHYQNLGYLVVVNCTNITVRNFNITRNGDGVVLAYSTNCTLTNITISGNAGPLKCGGLTFYNSNNNTIVNNAINNNSYAVCFYYSDRNIFYHNSFFNNSRQVVSDFLSPFSSGSSGYFSVNNWDDGYPSGGNYWSNYIGDDEKSGLSQNQTGSDGIGDTSHTVDADNIDRYPLMGLFNTFDAGTWNDVTYNVDVISNSTISAFNF